MAWEVMLKTSNIEIFKEVRQRAPHLWLEAQKLPGTGEVNTLNSIVLASITRNREKSNVIQMAIKSGERYLFGG